MPNRRFLEEYPLYRRFNMEIPDAVDHGQLEGNAGYMDMILDKPAIHMLCANCGSEQTFNMDNRYQDAFPDAYRTKGHIVTPKPTPEGPPTAFLTYRCTACSKYIRYFAVKFDPENGYVIKVGQEPPWKIAMDPALDRTLGTRADYYKNALVCESQGYGIGAFGYYRRITEEIIDELLEGIPDLMSGEEGEQYLEALEAAKKTRVIQEKIDLVKDLLPAILRPHGMNPLSTLHSILSEGLHQESDERCMELAAEVRETLVFLVNQIEVTKASSARFTDSMRRLLDRRKS